MLLRSFASTPVAMVHRVLDMRCRLRCGRGTGGAAVTLVVQFCCKKGRAASGWGFVAVDEARVLAAAVSFSGASGSDQARLPAQ